MIWTRFSLYFVCIVSLLVLGCNQTTASGNTATPVPADQNDIAIAPPDLSIYQDYLSIIREPSRESRDFVVEATVLSVIESDRCPYQEETCRITPYPYDWGQVRIDVILSELTAGGAVEGSAAASDNEEVDGGRTTGENTGVDLSDKDSAEIQTGQELQAQFLLTTRPTIVRWPPAVPQGDNLESATAPEDRFRPIPIENEHFVFAIGTSQSSQEERLTLPGLKTGDRFKATISFDGTVRVLLYEPLP